MVNLHSRHSDLLLYCTAMLVRIETYITNHNSVTWSREISRLVIYVRLGSFLMSLSYYYTKLFYEVL